ncbi:MAG: helix-turn-helix domain-containing protein [Acidimicrobiia bacterium]
MPESEWDIGPRLRAERQRAKLSLAQLASITGMSKTYLVKLETEPDANPSLEILRRIAEGLDLTVADLVGAPPLRGVSDERDIPSSLKAFADDVGLSRHEVETLASIRWRKADQPHNPQRWRYIYESLKASKVFDT